MIYSAYLETARKLSEEARNGEGAASLQFFDEAEANVQMALAIRPDGQVALNHGSATLIYRSYHETATRRASVLARAEEFARREEERYPGMGTYNIACIRALQGDHEGCRQWLERVLDAPVVDGDFTKEMLSTEPDFESVKDQGWFQALLERFPDRTVEPRRANRTKMPK